MVSNLQFFRRDPNYPKMNRGQGYYYHRGNNYWSKYTESKDASRKSPQTKGVNKTRSEKLSPHKGDYKATSRKSTRLSKGKIKGYF